jgi:hypothetical protein
LLSFFLESNGSLQFFFESFSPNENDQGVKTLKTSFLLALFLFESNHHHVFQSSESISSNEACLENVE